MSKCLSVHEYGFLRGPEVSRLMKRPMIQQGLSSKLHFLPKAASTPLTGDCTEQLLGAKQKKNKKRIAGIDQDELVEPALLADQDSCFCEFKGVQIHHKICDVETEAQIQDSTTSQFAYQGKTIGLPMILLHGFGSSVFSWDRVMKPLARVIGSKVVAFDRPAFGLTSRVTASKHLSPSSDGTKPLNPYSMIFSVLATLYFIDFLAADKAILVGHSAGSLVAVETYFEAPERVAALILVAPAILAPRTLRKAVKDNQFGKNNKIHEDSSDSNVNKSLIIRIFATLSKFFSYFVHTIKRMVKGMAAMIKIQYKKALSAFLRSSVAVMLIRMAIDKFGIPGIRNAWYDSNKVTDHVLQGYTKPLRTRGWERALLEYTAAMLTDPDSELKPPLSERLGEISCPVLIVTGDSDRFVPSWNAERLSRAVPGSRFEVIKNCGHLPQEEKAEEFLSIVDRFLQSVFGGLESQRLQQAAA